MIPEQWYYSDGESVIGPFTEEQLHEQHAAGSITDDTLVCKAGVEEWIACSDAISSKSKRDCASDVTPTGHNSTASGSRPSFTNLLSLNFAVVSIIVLTGVMLIFGAGLPLYNRWQEAKRIANEGLWGPYPIIGESVADTAKRLNTSEDDLTLNKNGLQEFVTLSKDHESGIATYFSDNKVVGFTYIPLKKNIPKSEQKYKLSEARSNVVQRDVKSVYQAVEQIIYEGDSFADAAGNEIELVAMSDGTMWVYNKAFQEKIGILEFTISPVESEKKQPPEKSPIYQTREFKIPTEESNSVEITAGPDGNLWFTQSESNKVGRISFDGKITEFNIPTSKSSPRGIAAGKDGNVWFTESEANKVAKITPAGVITEFKIPAEGSQPDGISNGPDGSLWFTTYDGIWCVTPEGKFTNYPIPIDQGKPLGPITSGADGNVWFLKDESNKIGRVTPKGVFTEFVDASRSSKRSGLGGITSGPDGNIWYTETRSDKIWRVTPEGVFTGFLIPSSNCLPRSIASGPDGNLWFTQEQTLLTGKKFEGKIGRITPSGEVAEFHIPNTADYWRQSIGAGVGICAGPDGCIWITETGVNKILRFGPVKP